MRLPDSDYVSMGWLIGIVLMLPLALLIAIGAVAVSCLAWIHLVLELRTWMGWP